MDFSSSFERLFVFIVFLTIESRASDIRFIPDGNNTNIGTLELKVSIKWYPVCRNQWGTHEAKVACKQAGYQGGWPYDVKKKINYPAYEQFLTSVQCIGKEDPLQHCMFELSPNCLDDQLAGVQCYKSFEVRLVGGITPNIGRVEVRYDDVWANVCYEGGLGNTDWGFNNVQILCKELGFPGAMVKEKGGQGIGNRRFTISDYRCREDLDHSSISECYPDHFRKTDNYPPCGEDNDAVVSCAVPGYIGCYERPPEWGSRSIRYSNMVSNRLDMTIGICRNFCRVLKARFAALYETTCYCADSLLTQPARNGDRDCNRNCLGNKLEACGGVYHWYYGEVYYVSVYDVTIGFCKDPFNASKIYDYGEMYTVNDSLKCISGQELVGEPVIQCVLGDSPNETRWNTSLPYCKDDDDVINLAIVVMTIGGGVLGILVVIVIMLALITGRKRKDSMTDNRSTSVPQLHVNQDNSNMTQQETTQGLNPLSQVEHTPQTHLNEMEDLNISHTYLDCHTHRGKTRLNPLSPVDHTPRTPLHEEDEETEDLDIRHTYLDSHTHRVKTSRPIPYQNVTQMTLNIQLSLRTDIV